MKKQTLCRKCGSADLEQSSFFYEDIKDMRYACNNCDYSWTIDINNKEELKQWQVDLEFIQYEPYIPHTESMNIYAQKGDKVIYFRDTGYGKDRENARLYLRMGQIYTVERTVVFSDLTIVFLQEYPGIPFNSVQFKDLKH